MPCKVWELLLFPNQTIMKKAKLNLSSYSFENTSVAKGGTCYTQYSSAAQLGKIGKGGERRAPEYKLENLKK